MKIIQTESMLAFISIVLAALTTVWWINKMLFDDQPLVGYMGWLLLAVSVSFTLTLTLLTYGLKRHIGNQIVLGVEAKFIYGSCFGFLVVLLMSIPYTV